MGELPAPESVEAELVSSIFGKASGRRTVCAGLAVVSPLVPVLSTQEATIRSFHIFWRSVFSFVVPSRLKVAFAWPFHRLRVLGGHACSTLRAASLTGAVSTGVPCPSFVL